MDYKNDGFEEWLPCRIMICYLSCGFLNRVLYLVFKLMTPMYLPGLKKKRRTILHDARNSYISMINLLGKSFSVSSFRQVGIIKSSWKARVVEGVRPADLTVKGKPSVRGGRGRKNRGKTKPMWRAEESSSVASSLQPVILQFPDSIH